MKKRHKGLFVSALLAAIFVVAFGCTFFIYQKQGKNAKAEDLTVVTSFYPMYIAALNVCDGVEGIHLENLSEPQTGCLHDYQLTPEDMKLLQWWRYRKLSYRCGKGMSESDHHQCESGTGSDRGQCPRMDERCPA